MTRSSVLVLEFPVFINMLCVLLLFNVCPVFHPPLVCLLCVHLINQAPSVFFYASALFPLLQAALTSCMLSCHWFTSLSVTLMSLHGVLDLFLLHVAVLLYLLLLCFFNVLLLLSPWVSSSSLYSSFFTFDFGLDVLCLVPAFFSAQFLHWKTLSYSCHRSAFKPNRSHCINQLQQLSFLCLNHSTRAFSQLCSSSVMAGINELVGLSPLYIMQKRRWGPTLSLWYEFCFLCRPQTICYWLE